MSVSKSGILDKTVSPKAILKPLLVLDNPRAISITLFNFFKRIREDSPF